MCEVIDAQNSVAELADYWLAGLRSGGRLESTTINEYERVLRKLVIPAIGSIQLMALTTDRIDSMLADLGTRGVNPQRKAKVVMGAMLDVAVDHEALPSNPARGTMSVRRPKNERRPVSLDEVGRVRVAIRTWANAHRPGPKSGGDLADIIDVMMATGARIGEVLAIRWEDVDLERRLLVISGTIKTEPGRGAYRKPQSTLRTIVLASFAVNLLARRLTECRDTAVTAVFPTRNGTWQQVNNVERRWRQVRLEAGLEWVTPDALRGVMAPEV